MEEKLRISNGMIINAVAGVIYQMHPYKAPENMDKIMSAVVEFYDKKVDCCGHINDNFKLFEYENEEALHVEINTLLKSVKEFRQLNISRKLKEQGVDDVNDERNKGIRFTDRYSVDNKDTVYDDFIDLDACIRNIVNQIIRTHETEDDCMFCKFALRYGVCEPSYCEECQTCILNPKIKYNRVSHPMSLKPENQWTEEEKRECHID